MVDVGCGASNGYERRMDSAFSNETVKGQVVTMCGEKMFTAVETCIGGVR